MQTVSTKLVTAGIGFAVDQVINAVVAAAKDDEAALTLTGSHPDLLFYRNSDDEKFVRHKCIAVVVASKVPNGKFCEPIAAWPPGMCSGPAKDKNSVALWEELGLGVPAFFARIDFNTPEAGAPAGYTTPQLMGLYYPRPLANREASKVEGLTITVKGLLPSKSNAASGDSAMEIVLSGEGLKPTYTDYTVGNLEQRGLWMKMPEQDPKQAGKLGSNPVNLVATLTETPNVTKWLQKVATYAEKNRADIKTKVDARINPSTIADAEKAEETADKTAAVAAATACKAFLTSLEAAKKAYDEHVMAKSAIQPGDFSTTIVADTKRTASALASAQCSSDRLKAQGMNPGSPVCQISQVVENEAKNYCK
ncbi:MAG: hypothetical protein ACT4P0_02895 [Panacagrimonas sp.]